MKNILYVLLFLGNMIVTVFMLIDVMELYSITSSFHIISNDCNRPFAAWLILSCSVISMFYFMKKGIYGSIDNHDKAKEFPNPM